MPFPLLPHCPALTVIKENISAVVLPPLLIAALTLGDTRPSLQPAWRQRRGGSLSICSLSPGRNTSYSLKKSVTSQAPQAVVEEVFHNVKILHYKDKFCIENVK